LACPPLVPTRLTLSRRSGLVDLEAEFEPSLLNSAIYLLQLIQQVSTFAINYQGRPFRESLSENRAMFYGILGVSGLAFVCAMELMPEINEQMKLVKFTEEFKLKMAVVMALDYVLCFVIEKGLKAGFSDYQARDIAERRPDQLERENARKKIEAEKKAADEEAKRMEKVVEFERQVAERRRKLEDWRAGRTAQ
jgi:cation-transporting ATPase 13A1